MRINVSLSQENYDKILGILVITQHTDLANAFQSGASQEQRVTNFPYFVQGGVVTNPKEHSPHHVQHSLPPRGEPTTPPLPLVIKASPASRDMWGHAT